MIPFQTSRRASEKLINESTLRLDSGEILISVRKGKNEGGIDYVSPQLLPLTGKSNLVITDARRPLTR